MNPLAAAAMAVFLFSLAGIPPLAGFWGKLAVFGAALSVRNAAGGADQWFVALAVVGVLNAAVAAVYYLRIVVAMYLREPLGSYKQSERQPAWAAVVVCALAIVAIGLWPRPLVQVSQRIAPPPDRAVAQSDVAAETARAGDQRQPR
jgi:NADH-quinone oxidoreductase subunit N